MFILVFTQNRSHYIFLHLNFLHLISYLTTLQQITNSPIFVLSAFKCINVDPYILHFPVNENLRFFLIVKTIDR